MRKTHYLPLSLALAALLLFGGSLAVTQAASNKASPKAIALAKDKDGGNPTFAHLKPELLKAYTTVLGLTSDQLKAEMDNKTIYQIAKSKGMKKAAFRKQVGENLQAEINAGRITGAKAKYYTDYIKWTNSPANKD